MKIAVINGSARKGNTLAMVNAFIEGAKEKNEIEIIQADELKLSACTGCGACALSKGCVAKDDTNAVVDKLVAADMIVFASPVYWWGITGQLKLLIDKCYSKGILLKGKKVGVLIVGGAAVGDKQYDLIRSQFECIKGFLNWDIKFHNSYSANGKEELANNAAVMEEVKKLGAELA